MRKKKSTKPVRKPAKAEQMNAVEWGEGGRESVDFGGLPPRDLKKNLGCG
jgi:hypothetical protein